jgi:hypothetical protein
VALIYDDDAEGVHAVVLGKKAGEVRIVVVQSQRLVGSDVDASILRGVLAVFCFDDTGVVSKNSFQLGIGLPAQFVAVAEE